MRKSPFHPELRLAAALIPTISFGPRLASIVNRLSRLREPPLPSLDGVQVSDFYVEGVNANAIRVRLYSPTSGKGPAPVLLWMHGGGYFTGVPEQDEALSINICRALGYVVACVDYRLAVESPYPAPLEDCYSVLKWLDGAAAKLKIDCKRIAVGGASAGGGLAAGLALLAHDRGEIRLSLQVLIYPMLDDRTVDRVDIDEKKLRMWTMSSNRFGWSTYLGCKPGGIDVADHAAPARRLDMSGLPPAWIGVGTLDLLHDEAIGYARRLSEAGVPCQLVVVPGAFHGFELAGRKKRVVRDFRQSYFDALARAGAGQNTPRQ